MAKRAVILFNLGGPDSLKAVKPFLFNLFNDKAIINLPQPGRWLLAKLISGLRNKKAQGIYKHLGGKSPLLPLTTEQAEALEKMLNERADGDEYKVFVCMRYWHPMTDMVVKKTKAFAPDHVTLLPLYPQYSTTTTGSSLDEWHKQCEKAAFKVPTTAVCCYPADRGLVAAHVKLIKEMYWKASEHGKPRVLFSAHGLPQKIIDAGDPYQWQVERTVAAITQVLSIDELDAQTCYQSKVGRLEWIGPSTEEEIKQAGKDKVPVLVVPVAFVSEHSETLVELDIDYRKMAEAAGVLGFYRVQALNMEHFFIESLADMCLEDAKDNALSDGRVRPAGKERICPRSYGQCACNV
jgi:ferrochelatase